MFQLTDKVALVTGATGGIGSAIARAMVESGCRVAATGTRTEALDQLAADLGETCTTFACNLADRAAVDALIPEVEEKVGPIDILVNNAGITRDNLAIKLSDDDWDAVLEVNLTAAFRLARAVLRGMIRRRNGRIISIGSVVGSAGNPGQVNYAAAKAGLTGMTKSLAKEVARRKVTVNCIAPGYIETAMTANFDEARYAAALADVPADRFGTPREVAAAVVFLASDEAAYVTGQTIHINGGGHMGS
jgi:3-oxoacyl-[acyl-carrier protein] reductase